MFFFFHCSLLLFSKPALISFEEFERMKFSLVIFAALAVLAFAKCSRYTVEVKNSAELSKALKNARPGANISLAPGVYDGSLTISVKGD